MEKINKNQEINNIIKTSYLKYAHYVIKERTLPDIRDGLKPVHRRILFSMYKLKNFYKNEHKKSARIVGDVIGKYHPHGDISIYKSIVKMTQTFLSRYPLIDGQGNFGTIDNDPPAAMRYTEIKLSKIANEMIKDLNLKNIPYTQNYDNTEYVPITLPIKIPNLLLNGSIGISVGMKTNIPPHNLYDTINTCIFYLNNKNASIKELIKNIKGPDFPTGGIIKKTELNEIYTKGCGTIQISSNIEINKKQIIIHDLPYKVSKNEILKKLLILIKKKKIFIQNINDQSYNNNIKIILNLKNEKIIETKEKILKLKKLNKKYNINMLVIKNQKPTIVNLKEIIEEFIIYRKKIIKIKKKEEIEKQEKEINQQISILYAMQNIDNIITMIKNFKKKNEIIKILKEIKIDINKIESDIIKNYLLKKNNKLNDEQINFILNKNLHQIINFKNSNIQNILIINIKKLNEINIIINESKYIEKIIIKELEEIKNKFKYDRKTQII